MGLIGAVIVSPHDNAEANVKISCDGVLNVTSSRIKLPKAGVRYLFTPALDYRFRELAKTTQSMPLGITVSLAVDGQPIGEKNLKATLRSINDCPIYFADPKSKKVTDLSFMFAAYVNEEHPLLDKLRNEALAARIVNDFKGYQAHDPKDVEQQVYAIWNVLQRRGVKYSSITTVPSSSPNITSQHVRLLDQSLENAQANCVDGSVLFASALRQIGIHSYLVLVPGHCFVAFATDEEDKTLEGLETTMIGSITLKIPKDKLLLALQKNYIEEKSHNSFRAAVQVGCDRLRKEWTQLHTPGTPGYKLISIDKCRTLGINAIPFMPVAQ